MNRRDRLREGVETSSEEGSHCRAARKRGRNRLGVKIHPKNVRAMANLTVNPFIGAFTKLRFRWSRTKVPSNQVEHNLPCHQLKFGFDGRVVDLPARIEFEGNRITGRWVHVEPLIRRSRNCGADFQRGQMMASSPIHRDELDQFGTITRLPDIM